MSDAIKYIDVDDEQFEDAPKALRDAYKALRKSHETVTTERDGARQTLASRAVGDVLADKGFKNPKRVERDLLADKVDPLDKSAVDAWLAENADDYAKGEGAPAAAAELTEDQRKQQEAFQALNAGGDMRAASDMSKWELAQAEITDAMSGAEITAVYKKHGI